MQSVFFSCKKEELLRIFQKVFSRTIQKRCIHRNLPFSSLFLKFSVIQVRIQNTHPLSVPCCYYDIMPVRGKQTLSSVNVSRYVGNCHAALLQMGLQNLQRTGMFESQAIPFRDYRPENRHSGSIARMGILLQRNTQALRNRQFVYRQVSHDHTQTAHPAAGAGHIGKFRRGRFCFGVVNKFQLGIIQLIDKDHIYRLQNNHTTNPPVSQLTSNLQPAEHFFSVFHRCFPCCFPELIGKIGL